MTGGKLLMGVIYIYTRDHDEFVHSLRVIMHSLGQDEITDVHVLTGDHPLDTTHTNITGLPQDPTTTTPQSYSPPSRYRPQQHDDDDGPGDADRNPDGEWPSLTYVNWLLDQRFGHCVQPYLAHFVKTYSAPILQEVAAIWGEELTEVSL